jgi:ribosome-associated translation inhibitor RaiA
MAATGYLQVADDGVEVMIRGRLPLHAKEYAVLKMTNLMRLAPQAVTAARVRISQTHHRHADESVVVEVNLEADSRAVRVQVAAGTAREGIDLAQDRLRRKLSQLGRHPARGSARERPHRPSTHARPPGEREVRRHKTFTPAVATAEEAIFDLDLMDYDFQLFTDRLSGVDSVIYRDGAGGYRISRLDGNAAPTNASVPILVDPWKAPRLTLQQAADALDATGSAFLFFANPASGRGNVLYRRYDGHYGLITPAG